MRSVPWSIAVVMLWLTLSCAVLDPLINATPMLDDPATAVDESSTTVGDIIESSGVMDILGTVASGATGNPLAGTALVAAVAAGLLGAKKRRAKKKQQND